MHFFSSITEHEFNRFIEEHPKGHILQTFEWGKFKSIHEWDMHLVGLKENDRLVAASLLLSRELPVIKKKILYAPRGFVIDFNNTELLSTFTKELQKFGKQMGAIFIKIDPDILLQERDIDGNIIEGGKNNKHIIQNLINLGYKHKGTELNFSGVQPRFSFRLDISGTEKEVFDNFHSKTRYNVRLAEKKGIEIIEGSREDLVKFTEIMDVTGKRDGFMTRPLSYFEEMYDSLVPTGKMKLFLAKYNVSKALDIALAQELDVVKRRSKVEKQLQAENINPEKEDKLRKQLQQTSEEEASVKERIEELSEHKKQFPDGVIVSGAILVLSGDKAWYLYGASDNIYRNLMPNYLIQWEMIRYSKQQGCTLYDFRGISGDLSESNPLYGLYRFKRGFNGDFTEFIGEFDYILSPLFYYAWETLLPKFKKIRRKLLRR